MATVESDTGQYEYCVKELLCHRRSQAVDNTQHRIVLIVRNF